MRFRKPLPSHFEALFTDLFEDADQAGEAPQPSHRFSIASLEAAWGVAAQARALPLQHSIADARRIAYGDETDGGPDISLDPNKILSELGLHSEATEAEIAMLRREFALRNHPDRVPAELRDMATRRMMIANDLMDRHLAKFRRAGG